MTADDRDGRGETLLLLDEGRTTPVGLHVTKALAEAAARAARVNGTSDVPDLSFTSLFIGLVAGSDAIGKWSREYLTREQPVLESLLARGGLRDAEFDELRRMSIRAGMFSRPLRRTISARSALTEAERLARDAGSELVDTRHVLAAFVALPQYHEADFRDLGMDRREWARAFARAAAESYPREAAFWGRFTQGVFAEPTPAQEPSAPAVPEGARLALDEERFYPHVSLALRDAAELAAPGSIEPRHVLYAAVRRSGRDKSEAFNRFAELSGLTLERTSDAPRTVTEVQLAVPLMKQLEWAMSTSAANHVPRLWGRDLITAALLCHDGDLEARLHAEGRWIWQLRDAWYAFVTTSDTWRSEEDWDAWWRAAGVPVPGPSRTAFALETDEGEDKLGIESEARAFARLILDRDVKAPLSIGLLGDWGSGKSFFIEQVKRQIGALKEEGRPELYSNIVEIEFNAWHASDANLWASLVTYIFDEIWSKVSRDRHVSPEEARRLLRERIEKARGAVHEAEAQVALARSALQTTEADLAARRERLAWSRYAKSVARKRLQSLARNAGSREPLETINEVEGALRELQSSTHRLRLIATTLLEKPATHVGLPAALFLAATALIWRWGVPTLADFPSVAELVKYGVAALSALGTLVAPLTMASRKLAALTSALETIQSEYDAEVTKAGTEVEEEIGEARRELESAQASVSAAKARLAELLNQQASLDPGRRLGEFLQDRVQSTLYRSQQGIISLVHRDFRQLSDTMRELRERASTDQDGEKPDIEPIDRIVLYVDDLDRCRPQHVVNMLEAVHLLLALDLFVVVVAVDSRWLTRALEIHYKELLAPSDGARSLGPRVSTPQSYLEKIFQITYALGPMNPAYLPGYIASLAGPVTPAQAASSPRTERDRATPLDSQTVVRATREQDAPREPTPGTGHDAPASPRPHAGARATTPQPGPSAGLKLPPPLAVPILPEEQAWICRLGGLLTTPRIAKRLVNVYRLIKASKSPAALARFEQSGRPETCLLMLAILFGRTEISAELVRALHEGDPPFDEGSRPLTDAIRQLAATRAGNGREAWQELLRVLEEIGVPFTVAQCAREPAEIARYSLSSGHEWHMWSRPPRGASRARSDPAAAQ